MERLGRRLSLGRDDAGVVAVEPPGAWSARHRRVPDDEVTRELADLCVTFGEGRMRGVEPCVREALPDRPGTAQDGAGRRASQARPERDLRLRQLGADRARVDRELAATAAAVAVDLQDDLAQLYDQTERSPATQVVQYLQDQGIDLTDNDPVQRGVSMCNAEQNARRLLPDD